MWYICVTESLCYIPEKSTIIQFLKDVKKTGKKEMNEQTWKEWLCLSLALSLCPPVLVLDTSQSALHVNPPPFDI